MARYLVVYCEKNGIGSVDCEFVHMPPTMKDIMDIILKH